MVQPGTRSSSSDILLFASQGSNAHMASDSLKCLENIYPETRRTLEIFLQRCLQVFHEEVLSLSPNEEKAIGPWATVLHDFDEPEKLLSPVAAYQSNPVLESSTIYMHQILDLFLYLSEPTHGILVEVGGVCSGMLPASLAASFPSVGISADFLDYAVDGFRLAFWIGIRTSLFCRNTASQVSEGSWCLTIKGSSLKKLQEIVVKFNSSQSPIPPIRISVIFSKDVISLVGNPKALQNFKDELSSPTMSAHFPHVHGYYHGGQATEETVSLLLEDVRRRQISFPTWDLLQVSIRSTGIDQRMLSKSEPLVKSVLRSMLVDTINWKENWDHLNSTFLTENTAQQLSVVLLGPNTSSLRLPSLGMKLSPKVEITTNSSRQHMQAASSNDIAVVGMSINFPIGDSAAEFWESLKSGVNTVSEIPSTRFDRSYYNREREHGKGDSRSMSVKHGNFIENPFDFDPTFWNISPREAKSMDPQQRLLLRESLYALEDGGYAPESTPTYQKETFGVFVGVATGDYTDNLRDDPDVYYSTGTLRAFLSGKISYAFGFQGPSLVVDTACSSSLVAIHQACKALQREECTAALAGGVNVISSPDMYLGLARAHFLSDSGQCKPFDEAADGYSRSEGCGIVVLKLLSHAIDEGDRILGIIRGTELNQCGESKSITHPDHSTQAALFRKLLAKSHLSPEMVNVVEAHGTGTQAGDLAETRSLRSVFEPNRSSENPLYISSVKGNMGHAEAASGVAGLAKIILEMKNQQIPSQASLTKFNPRLGFEPNDFMVVPRKLSHWTLGKHSRRIALLNNFGAAGSNAALILEEPREIKSQNNMMAPRSSHILNISAKSTEALNYLKTQLVLLIDAHQSGLDPYSLCYSANARRTEYTPYRVSVTGKTLQDLSAQLRQTQIIQTGIKPVKRKVVYVFSGQGAMHPGMGSELLQTSPVYRSIVLKCDKLLSINGFPLVSPYLSSDSHNFISGDQINQIIISQCAGFVLEYALAQTWMSWGVVSGLVLGHSLGEYAAFATAGILSMADALLLVARRAQLMGRFCQMEYSGMLACHMSPEAVQDLINANNSFSQLSIVCLNSPNNVVVAGPLVAIDELKIVCQNIKAKATKLKVPFGFHSTAMEPMLDDFRKYLSSVQLKSPVSSVGSTLYGRILSLDEKIPVDYFAEQARKPIEFCKLAEDVAQTYPEENLTFLEIGPSSATISNLSRLFPSERALLIPSLSPKESSWVTINKALQALYFQPTTINWRGVYAGTNSRFIDCLPRYPLDQSNTFFVPYKEELRPENDTSDSTNLENTGRKLRYHFLASVIHKDASKTEFLSDISAMSPFIEAHKLGGVALCPASVHLELALEAFSLESGPHSGSMHFLESVEFSKPLVLSCNERKAPRKVSMSFVHPEDSAAQFTSSSPSEGSHCTGTIPTIPNSKTKELLARKTAYVQRQMRTSPPQTTPSDMFSSETIYKVIFPRVVAYSSPLKTLRHLKIENSGLEARGVFHVPHSESKDIFVSDPAFIDTLLHAPGFVANFKAESDSAYICFKIDRLVLPTDTIGIKGQDLEIYCSLVHFNDSVIAEAYVLNSQGDIISWAEGMAFKKVALKPFEAYLTRLSNQSQNDQGKCFPKSPKLGLPEAPSSEAPPIKQNGMNGAQSSSTEHSIRSIIYQTCELNPGTIIFPETTLDELGIDSLLLIEISSSLQEKFPQIDIELEMTSWRTVQDVEASINSAYGTNTPHTKSSLDTEVTDVSTKASSIYKSHDLTDLFQRVFGFTISDKDKRCSLGSLGVDSLGSKELTHEMQSKWGVTDLKDIELSELTFLELENMLQATRPSLSEGTNVDDNHVSSNDRPGKVLPVPFGQQIENSVPLYLFHDGSGRCSMYSNLSVPGHNMLGIHSLDIGGKPKVTTLEELASIYIEEAGLLDEERPVILGGWSFGGVLAIETARQMREGGKEVIGVILIDSPAPFHHEALPHAIIEHIAGGSAPKSQARRDVVEQFHRHAVMLQNYNLPPQSTTRAVMIQCTQSFDTKTLCGVEYPWLSSTEGLKQNFETWDRLLGGRLLSLLELHCNHFEVFNREHKEALSELIVRACGYLEGKGD